jgi:hypothetical protein
MGLLVQRTFIHYCIIEDVFFMERCQSNVLCLQFFSELSFGHAAQWGK